MLEGFDESELWYTARDLQRCVTAWKRGNKEVDVVAARIALRGARSELIAAGANPREVFYRSSVAIERQKIAEKSLS